MKKEIQVFSARRKNHRGNIIHQTKHNNVNKAYNNTVKSTNNDNNNHNSDRLSTSKKRSIVIC